MSPFGKNRVETKKWASGLKQKSQRNWKKNWLLRTCFPFYAMVLMDGDLLKITAKTPEEAVKHWATLAESTADCTGT